MSNISHQTAELSTEEKRKLLAQLLRERANKTKSDLQYQSIYQWFEAQVKQTPDAVAVVIGNQQLTYRELNQRANQLAHYLRSLNVTPEGLVGLYMEPSLDMVVGLLGILKAGGAYVPLDPTYPQEWLAFVFADSQMRILLSQQHLKTQLPASSQIKTIYLDTDWEEITTRSQENPSNATALESLACVLYSYRRGVLVEHHGIHCRLRWLRKQFSLSQTDTVLHIASLVQETAVWEILLPLVTGGRLVLATKRERNQPTALGQLISTHQISLVHFVPSALAAFLESLQTGGSSQLPSLRSVLCSGEPLSPALVKLFYQHLNCNLHYLYCLPEASGEVASRICQLVNNRDVLPVGYPTTKAMYVLDRYSQLVPIGVTGEICVAGEGLARGYLHAPEETAKRFVANPFSKTAGVLFKTGELGRLLNDGSLELVGSLERQVWIAGFRVSLQEIAVALLALPTVEDCWVLQKNTETGIPQLVAYVVLSGPFVPEQLQSHLQTLPAYMLPSAYVPVTSLPLTATGQVDEQNLQQLAVIDINLKQRWESQLQSIPEVEQVAIVESERTEKIPLLHLCDLLADWKTDIAGNEPEVTVPTRSPELQPDYSHKKLAISHGGVLPKDASPTPTLPEALQRAVQQAANQGLVYVQSDGLEIDQSYQDLLAEAECILAGLRQLGLQPQDKVIFQLELTQDFIPAFWSCMLGGFIPVPVSIAPAYDQVNSAISKLQIVWQMLDKPLVLTGARLAREVRSLSGLLGLENFQVATVDDLRQHNSDSNWHSSQPEDLALLMLTSGSTGIPKAVTLRHCHLLSMTAGTRLMNGFDHREVTLNWMPMDHVGALVFLSLMAVDLGCQQVHVPTDLILQNPLKWLDLIDRHRATISWAPNFAFTLICDRASEINCGHWQLGSMRFLVNAGEAVVTKTARTFLKLLSQHGLPSTALHPAFGMCETCSGITWSNSFSLETTADGDAFVSVGPPIPGASLQIVDENGQVVEEGVSGRLQLKGNSVTSGYYQNPEANRQSFNEAGWFSTGDLGFLRDGCLTITGREKDIIIINGSNYYSHEIESTVEEIDGVEVSYTAACAVREGGDTDKLAIFFNSSFTDENRLIAQFQEIRAKVVKSCGVNPSYLIPIAKSKVPKTAIGKIQRLQLGKRLEAGEFNDIIKRFDLLTGNANTLPNWFYQKVWRQKEASTLAPLINKGQTVVFLDMLGLGTCLCTQLEKQLQPCVKVEVGAKFAQIGANHYCIVPDNPDHYRLLLESVRTNGTISQILHLWTYDNFTEISSGEALAQAQAKGVYSLLFLVQALFRVQSAAHPVQLRVISSQTQAISAQDVPAYAKAPALGLVKTISQEMPWLTCRHIDLPVDQLETNGAYILQELAVLSKEREVAYRHGKRLIAQLKQVNLAPEKQPLPFKQGGMYLVSGGLGDIGVEIAKYLLQHYKARLLLVGRTPLPDKAQWTTYLQQKDTVSERIKAYQQLEPLGEVFYQAVDIGNLAQLQQIVQQAESLWGSSLDGVIHLAGVYQEHLLVDETQDSLTATLQPKVFGTWTLHQLIKGKSDSIFISFSSIASFFGGAMIGAYTAANSFLESFSQYQCSQGLSHSYCFAWGPWDGLGVSRRSQMKGLTQVRGYYAMTAKQGLHSFLAGLHHNQKHAFIGLDGSNSNIRRFTEPGFSATQKLTAYLTTGTSDLPIAQLQALEMHDRFQTPSACDFVQLAEMPLTDTGAVDMEQLISLGRQRERISTEKVAPQTEVECQLASIWQEVLGVSQIGIYDNFFELGGNSLLAVQLISRIGAIFQVELSLSALLEAQTVAGLASLVSQPFKTYSPLVALQPAGNKPPFFCIHPVGGNILCYGDLARHLGTKQPFYGLQSPGLNGNFKPLTSIENMATYYIEAMQTVQPNGPYYLGGWSLGGLIAFEMAQQLQAVGQEIALLALIDSYAANRVAIPESLDRAMLLATVVRDLGEIAGKEVPISVEELQQFTPDEQLQYVQERTQQMNVLPPELGLQQMQQLLNVFQVNHQAWFHYIPQRYSGKLTLFYASEQLPQATQEPSQFWGELAVKGFQAHEIPGDHYAIVRGPQVRVLSEQLKAYLS